MSKANSTNIDLNSLSSTAGFQIAGSAAGDKAGFSVSAAGDINDDGVDDILVGGYTATAYPGESNGGIVYVIFGNRTQGSLPNLDLQQFATSMHNGFCLLGRVNMMVGYRTSRAGDIDADGYDDFMFSAIGSAFSYGVTFVVFGRNVVSPVNAFYDLDIGSFNTGSIGFRILGATAGDQSGTGLSAAGDVNNDGVDDILIGAAGATYADRNVCGVVYVVFGQRRVNGASAFTTDVLLQSMSFSTGYRMYGAYSGDQTGRAISGAGDLNGDGIDDILIGVAFANNGAIAGAGRVYVIYGHTDSGNIDLRDAPGAGLGFTLSGANVNDYIGYSVSDLGDVNGDGLEDVIIGSPYTNTGVGMDDTGMCYVLFGRNISAGAAASSNMQLSNWVTNSTNGFRISGSYMWADYSGWSVGGGGDVNGDGINDILVGAYGADPFDRMDAGAVFIVFGKRTVGTVYDVYLLQLLTEPNTGYIISGAKASDLLSSYALDMAGDVNDDGIDDIIIGAYMAAPANKSAAGMSYVIFGAPGAPSSQPSSQPSAQPSRQPSRQPTRQPTSQPSLQPSIRPSGQPSRQPSSQPTIQPSTQPISRPTNQPTVQPFAQPSMQPSTFPSTQPSTQPSSQPSKQPSAQPTKQPSSQPSMQPSCQPSTQPTRQPSRQPSARPSSQPSAQPSVQPSAQPSSKPSGLHVIQPHSLAQDRAASPVDNQVRSLVSSLLYGLVHSLVVSQQEDHLCALVDSLPCSPPQHRPHYLQ